MRLNLIRSQSPAHVLDVLPETPGDQEIIMDFLSKITNKSDFMRVVVAPLENEQFGGICIWLE